MRELIVAIEQMNRFNISDLLSLLLSVIAVVVAIYIPSRISKRQDKIALFEKRMNFYNDVCKCISFARMINNFPSQRDMYLFFIAAFKNGRIKGMSTYERKDEMLYFWNKLKPSLQQGRFLFGFDSESKQILELFISSLSALLFCEETHDSLEKWYGKYMDSARDMENEILPRVEDSLKLDK